MAEEKDTEPMKMEREDFPEKPYYSYISGVIDEDGKRYFLNGKFDKECNYFSEPFKITERRRIMLIELNAKMNPKQIYDFLNEHKHYFEELQEKPNPFDNGDTDV